MKIGLAGAPSSGKSSVVKELMRRGYPVFTEAATQIINLRISSGETLKGILSNPELFQQQIHDKKLLQLQEAGNRGDSFFDTTTVEDIAHRKVTGVETESIQKIIDEIRYDKVFYMVHPGSVEDNGIRVENQDEVQELDRLKRVAFKDNGYNIIEVPTFTNSGEELTDEVIEKAVRKRVDYILANL